METENTTAWQRAYAAAGERGDYDAQDALMAAWDRAVDQLEADGRDSNDDAAVSALALRLHSGR